MNISIDRILPNPDQPRQHIDTAKIRSMAQTMERDGQINPISVTGPHHEAGDQDEDPGYYIIIDGERRWRAARRLGWDTIKADVNPPDSINNGDRLVRALIGNVQREDLGVVDEARAYQKLRERMSVEQIAERVGYSNSHVYMRLKLLDGDLAPKVLDLLNRGKLPYDHPALRALRKLEPEQQVAIATRAAVNGSSGVTIKAACSRILNRSPFSAPRRTRKTRPGASVAPAFRVHDVELSTSHADIVEATIRICDQCGLGQDADGLICRDCPLASLMLALSEMESTE